MGRGFEKAEMTTRTTPRSQAAWLGLMMLIALSGLCTVFAPGVTAAEAWSEYAQARVDSELDPLTASAENGDDDAQLKLGMRYYDGISREKPPDYEKALEWFRRAADQGNAEAQARIGMMYHFGRGVPRDDAEAARWTNKRRRSGSNSTTPSTLITLPRAHGSCSRSRFWRWSPFRLGYSPCRDMRSRDGSELLSRF